MFRVLINKDYYYYYYYYYYCSVLQFISNMFLLLLREHPGVLRILSEANAGPTAIGQLFVLLLSGILKVIYKPRDRTLSVHIAAGLRLASIYTDKALSLGL